MRVNLIDRFTRGFFWFGFCVFLAASIPHIAAYYRHFDPNSTGLDDVANWIIGYAIAIAIDVTDVLVSIAVMKEMSKGTPKRALIGFWSFIVFVMLLSWLINWQYNLQFATSAFQKADAQAIFGMSVGSINPIIGSAFQLLLLVYTAMAHKFSTKPVEKSAADLKVEADEAEDKQTQIARLNAVKRAQNQEKIAGVFGTLGQAKAHVKTLVKGESNSVPNASQIESLHAVSQDSKPEIEAGQNEEFAEVKQEVKSESCEQNSGEFAAISEDVLEAVNRYPKLAALLTTGRPTYSIAEVSEATGHGTKLIANRIANGALKTHSRGENRILKNSLLQWAKAEPLPRQSSGQTAKIYAIKDRQKVAIGGE